LQHTADGEALSDEDQDAVVMEWEHALMRAHACVLMNEPAATTATTDDGQQNNCLCQWMTVKTHFECGVWNGHH